MYYRQDAGINGYMRPSELDECIR